MTFAEKLKALRSGAGMTQAGLATASGVALGTIRDYEQGKREPLLSSAQRLAQALRVSLDVFPSAVAQSPGRSRRPTAARHSRRK